MLRVAPYAIAMSTICAPPDPTPWNERQITDTEDQAPLCRYHHITNKMDIPSPRPTTARAVEP